MDADLIDGFVDATGSTIVEAMKYLKLCDQDLNTAVGCYFDPTLGRSSGLMGEAEEAVRAPIAGFTDRISDQQIAVGRLGKRPSIVFEEGDLGAMYKAPIDISFVGNLETAKIKGKNRKKWLLVNVQAKEVWQSQLLNRDLWCKEDVRDVIDRFFVFWQTFRDNLEGEHFVRFYKFKEFPVICIIDPNTGEMIKNWGFKSHLDFMKEMHEFTTHYKFESHGRRQSFDFFGKSRDELYRSVPVVAARVPTPPPATPPPSSPQPSEEEEEETISLPGQASLPAIVAKGTVHLTLRLPDGQRRTVLFSHTAPCGDLYGWLEKAGLRDHAVFTSYPRKLVEMESGTVGEVLGEVPRAVVVVSERD